MACATVFDGMRMKSEDLGPMLYLRASHANHFIGMVPRSEYPDGAGLARSVFTIARSEPGNPEETWSPITSINASIPGGAGADPGACANTWNPAYVGYLERQYGPEGFALVGPTVCQDELVLHWKSKDFWMKYFQALEIRNVRSLERRDENVYMNFVPHVACVTTIATGDPLAFNVAGLSAGVSTIIAPSQVYMGDFPVPTGSGSTSNYGELTQEILDTVATTLTLATANAPDSQGYVTQGPSGPVFPLLLGQDMSARIALNNSDFRFDLRFGYDSLATASPLLRERGAALVIKNFRHVITQTPPRWDWVTTGTAGGAISAQNLYLEPNTLVIYGQGTASYAAGTVGGTAYPAGKNVNGAVVGGGCWVRRPVYKNVTGTSTIVSKGYSSEINTDWVNAGYEGAEVTTPWVMTEEIMRPVGAFGKMSWKAQNYFGEWQFVKGIAAFIGIDNCVTPTGGDPLEERGRHFARYKHAFKPIFPEYGRMLLFKRCVPNVTVYRCGS